MKKVLLGTVSAIAIFMIASCGGGTSDNKGAVVTPPPSAAAPAAGTEAGAAVYKRTCIACHQTDGGGVAGTFPPLAKSDFIADREQTITQVIKGKSGEVTVNGTKYNNVMPPQALSEDDIAAVLTYVYSNFGNTGAAVTVAEVKAVREKIK